MEEKKIWTFESLAQCSRSELDNVLATSQAFDYEKLNGYIYCGWIHTWVCKLSGE